MKGYHFNISMISQPRWDTGILEFVQAALLAKTIDSSLCFTLCTQNIPNTTNNQIISRQLMIKWTMSKLIHWVLYQPHSLLSTLNQADIILFPTRDKYKTPYLLPLAVRLGIPVIASNTVSCRTLINNDCQGRLFKMDDVNSLVDTLFKFVKYLKYHRIIQFNENALAMDLDESIKMFG